MVQRERRLFRDLAPEDPLDSRPTVGMNRSFLVHTFFPFYNRFFAELGFRVVLPDEVDPDGVDQQRAAFCFPAELAHGYAASLLAKNPDFICLPHLRGIPSGSGEENSCTCVFVQGEPFYLRTAIPGLDERQVLTPFLDFTGGLERNRDAFRQIANQLGVNRARVKPALDAAIAEQEHFARDLRVMGRAALAELENDPNRTAVVRTPEATSSS